MGDTTLTINAFGKVKVPDDLTAASVVWLTHGRNGTLAIETRDSSQFVVPHRVGEFEMSKDQLSVKWDGEPESTVYPITRLAIVLT